MRLFVEHLPLVSWPKSPSPEHTLVGVEILPSESAAPGPATDQAQLWFLDTGWSGEALAFGYHLTAAGLIAPAEPNTVSLTWTVEGQTQRKTLDVWPADLWLVSNVPALSDTLYCLELNGGIARSARNVSPFERDHRALIGTRALRRAGVKLVIDFAQEFVSIWVPDGGRSLTKPVHRVSPLQSGWTI